MSNVTPIRADLMSTQPDSDPDGPALPGAQGPGSYEEAVSLGRAVVSERNWRLGDLAHYVETSYGDGRLQQYAADIGVEYQTLKQYRFVSRAYEKGIRILGSTWTVHQVFAAQPDRAALVRGEWTAATARAEVQRRSQPARPAPVPVPASVPARPPVPAAPAPAAPIPAPAPAAPVLAPVPAPAPVFSSAPAEIANPVIAPDTRKLGYEEIEVILAEGLGWPSVMERFGIGKAAAQAAVTRAGERHEERTRQAQGRYQIAQLADLLTRELLRGLPPDAEDTGLKRKLSDLADVIWEALK